MTSNDDLIAAAEALGPWHHKVRLRDGVWTGSDNQKDARGAPVLRLDTERSFDVATRMVFPQGLQGRSFLDCWCNCGGYSFAARDRGAGRVFGFDGNEHWIRQARFIQDHVDRDRSGMRFDLGSFDDLAAQGDDYDITWFSGIFHQVADPVATLKQVADRTREVLFLNTPCVWFDPDRPEQPELVFHPEGAHASRSDLKGVAWLPSGPKALGHILRWMGFAETRTYLWMQDASKEGPDATPPGPGRIALVAARDPALLAAMTSIDTPTMRSGPHPVPAAGRPATSQTTAARQISALSPGPAAATATTPAAETRPLAWEDDLAVHARDARPFEILPPPSTWPPEVFAAVPEPALKGVAHLPLQAMAARDTAPLPVPLDRENYNPTSDPAYWLSGLRDYHTVTEAVARHGGRLDRIMDVGAASGRVLRHFAFQSDSAEIWAAEVNHRHVRFLAEFMPAHVRPVAVPALPHYPVEDNSFDLVTAFSVFTHIDVFETAFLAELRRLLRPGGLACLTISDEHHWEALRQGATPSTAFLRRNMVDRYPGASEALAAPLAPDNRWFRHRQTGPYRGLAFTPQDHLRSVWSRFFQLEEIIPGGHNDQTLIIARKT